MPLKILLLAAFCILFAGVQKSLAQANTSLSNLANPTSVNRSLLPSSTGTLYLGSSSKGWKGIYLSSSPVMYLGLDRTLIYEAGKLNFFFGPSAGNTTMTGTNNSGFGRYALRSNTTGYGNTAAGRSALDNNESGYENTAVGTNAGYFNTGGDLNTFVGYNSGYWHGLGTANTFVGNRAGYNNTNAQQNSAFGYKALYANTYNYNSAFGSLAATAVKSGYNAAFGYRAMEATTSGGSNSVFGYAALLTNLTGDYNAIFGAQAGMSTKGDYNAFLGAQAGSSVTGSKNTMVGYHAGGFASNVSNSTALGHYTIISASNQVRVGDYLVTSIGGFQPWTNFSDGRFKKDIKENVPGLAFVNKLRPVTYVINTSGLREHYQKLLKGDEGKDLPEVRDDNKIVTGFVAQEVEEAAKKVDFIFDGVDAPKNDNDLYGLRYSEFVVPLVKAVQELSEMNDRKDSIISELAADIEELKRSMNDLTQGQGRSFDLKGNVMQNYPNPVSQSTVINFVLPDQFRRAELMLTDAGGKMIKRISLGKTQSGNISLDASGMASGVYNYSLIIDGKIVSTRKMTVTR